MNPNSCSVAPSSQFIEVSVNIHEQTLVYFPGDGDPLFMPDTMTRDALLDYIPSPVARAVFAARLRAFADMLEPSLLDDLAKSVSA